MSTATTDLPKSAADLPKTAAAAVTEAGRIAAEAARTSTETARASVEASRTYFDETTALGRDLVGTWSLQSETAIKAAFDAQNAAVEAGMGFFDLGVKGNRQAMEQFTDLVHRAQQATLESWQATVKLVTKAVELPKR
jgi:hypothetical protein